MKRVLELVSFLHCDKDFIEVKLNSDKYSIILEASAEATTLSEVCLYSRVEDQLDYVFPAGISKQSSESKFFLVLSMSGRN